MMRNALILTLGLAATVSVGPATAADDRPSLDEVMTGATAMATVANGYLFVARPDGAWVCAINVTSKHFAALIEGDDVVAEQTTPSTVCVPATHFKNAME